MGADLPPHLDRRFEALVLGWDVRSGSLHRPNAGRLRRAVEKLCSLGMELFVLSGSSMKAVDDELGARPGGPGHLYLCLNAASEVFLVGRSEPRLIFKGSGTQRGPAVDGIEEDELFQAPSREARVLDDAHHAGVAQLQASDSGRWILRHLWSIGIGPSQMAILGKQVGSWVGPDPKEG